jgi:hypothetical protein
MSCMMFPLQEPRSSRVAQVFVSQKVCGVDSGIIKDRRVSNPETLILAASFTALSRRST